MRIDDLGSKEYIKKKLEELMRSGEPCIVCGRPGYAAGMFIPNDPAKFGLKGPGERVFMYMACGMRNEKAIEGRLEVLGNGPGKFMDLRSHVVSSN